MTSLFLDVPTVVSAPRARVIHARRSGGSVWCETMATMTSGRSTTVIPTTATRGVGGRRVGKMMKMMDAKTNVVVRRRARTVVNASSSENGGDKPLVKVCGVTSARDAELATANGANFIGMILWPKSKRSVTREVAKEVATVAKAAGAVPVAVFVDEDSATITEVCDEIGVDHAQLHGDGAREALGTLPTRIKAIWVLNADADGKIVTKLPGDEETLIAERQKKMSGERGWKAAIDFVSGPRRVVDWLLIDGVNAGSGVVFDWSKLKVPRGCSRKGWLLAGGLNPDNVADAVQTVFPNGVDVASGVADEGGVVKDEAKIAAFISNARAAAATAAK